MTKKFEEKLKENDSTSDNLKCYNCQGLGHRTWKCSLEKRTKLKDDNDGNRRSDLCSVLQDESCC
jgi:hypothetical protein